MGFFSPKFFLSFSKWIFFLSLLHFHFFIKIIITPLRAGHRSKSEARGFLSLNLTFLGHDSGLCPKNLLSSKVISVSYNNFVWDFFTLKFFLSFSKWIFFSPLLHFHFFIKIIITPLRTGHHSKSEGRGFKSDIFAANISPLMTPVPFSRSRHNIASKS